LSNPPGGAVAPEAAIQALGETVYWFTRSIPSNSLDWNAAAQRVLDQKTNGQQDTGGSTRTAASALVTFSTPDVLVPPGGGGTGPSSIWWDPNYNPDPGDSAGHGFATFLAEHSTDRVPSLGHYLELNSNTMTNSLRQQRLDLLIHDLGPNGTAQFIAQLGAEIPSWSSSSNFQRLQALFRSTFISMIGNGSFGQAEAATLMQSMATQDLPYSKQHLPYPLTAWFTTNLLGSIPATSNSDAVKLSAAQELITLGKNANSPENRQDDYAQAADLLGTVAQTGGASGARQVLNILGNYSRRNPGFMSNFAQNATLGMMNLAQPGGSLARYGTAFPGMASLLNALNNMNDAASSTGLTAKDLAIQAFGGATQAIQNNPSQASALLTEERVLGQGGLRTALANTFAKYTPQCLLQWGQLKGYMAEIDASAQADLARFIGFELSPIGAPAAASTALNTLMRGAVAPFMDYVYSQGADSDDASIDRFLGHSTGLQKVEFASNYVGAMLGAMWDVANYNEGIGQGRGTTQQEVVDFADTVADAISVAQSAAGVAAGGGPEDPATWLAVAQHCRECVQPDGLRQHTCRGA
jgi:hypothetical protein